MTSTEDAPKPTQIKITEIYSEPKVAEVVTLNYDNETEEYIYSCT
jgi:hypothetical protein